jgi:arylsulfatase A-like enzyme
MNRREFLGTAAAAAAPAPQPGKPNLVYVFADQLGYQRCGYAGDEYARTPNIDRLAAQGCNLRQAISNTPVCAPYRASLMTGKCQSSTGMVINELRLSPEHECFGHVLTRSGYQTAYIGKWHLWANQWGGHELPRNGFVPPGPYRLGFDGLWAAYNFSHNYYGAPYYRDTLERHTWKDYEPDSQTTLAIDFIRQTAKAGRPFAVFLSWGPPHDPWTWNNVPPQYAALYRQVHLPLRPNFSEQQDPYGDAWAQLPENPRLVIPERMRVYYAQTASIDYNLGRLMDALDAAGASNNTILVFTSDHGEMFGSHGRMGKYNFYEEAIRVPFLVRWPGKIPAKTVSEALFGAPDIMPTLLSLMGLPVPRAAEGYDFSRHVLGQGGAAPGAALLQGMGTTAAWRDGTEWRAVRSHEYTYAVYRRDRYELLFHHRQDPYQLVNLAGDRSHAAALKHHREKLAAMLKERNDNFESCTWYRDHWTRERNIIDTATGVKHDLAKLDRIVRRYFPEGIPAPDR